MSETRSRQIMINLEPSIHEMLMKIVVKEDSSTSTFIRSLIISELRSQEIMSESDMERLLKGRSLV